jgi:hypothetical protein
MSQSVERDKVVRTLKMPFNMIDPPQGVEQQIIDQIFNQNS